MERQTKCSFLKDDAKTINKKRQCTLFEKMIAIKRHLNIDLIVENKYKNCDKIGLARLKKANVLSNSSYIGK